ncbi:14 kDa zinc-binding protein isoform X2 [Herrania umbratica]|uniref:14 kDa zinc-binding protein isoform X2 n=1 Tax=Herrania umbratica TaxID=108875 RepID=A0A6J1AF30_9ROSI|nr:14 kDa zinc-binding protein isoform X2 [Herrania umbratica]
MISAQKSMAAVNSFSLLRDYARAGRIVARVRASPGIASYPSSINFLTANHSRRYLCRASATHDEEAAAKAAAINADSGVPTIFDKIIAKEIPSTIVYEDDKVLAFKDVNPQAPVHVLVIPKVRDGLTQLGKAEPRHGEILGQLLYAAKIVAEKEGIVDGFRVVINNGPSACGRQMNWPPG